MGKQRDTKAEYRARVERAKAQGYSGYSEKERARRAGLGDMPVDRWRAIAAEKRAQADEIRRTTRKQIHEFTAGKRLVTTTARGKGWGVIRGQLERHGHNPVTLKLKLRDGSTRTVYGHGIDAQTLKRSLQGDLMGGAAAAANSAGNYGTGTLDAADIESVQIELDTQ